MNGTHHVADLGMVPLGFVGDEYLVELRLADRHLNIGGIVHGGVLCSMLDTAMARSYIMSVASDELPAVTLEIKVNFLESAKDGVLTARGRVMARTRRTVYVEGRVDNEEGRLLAKASATMILTPSPGTDPDRDADSAPAG